MKTQATATTSAPTCSQSCFLAHDGFAEYYDPQTGKGWGAREQLWSACLFLVATDALFPRHDWQD